MTSKRVWEWLVWEILQRLSSACTYVWKYIHPTYPSVSPPSFSLSFSFTHTHMYNPDFLLLLCVFCQSNLCSNPHTTARQTGPPRWMSLNLTRSVHAWLWVCMCVWETHGWGISQVRWFQWQWGCVWHEDILTSIENGKNILLNSPHSSNRGSKSALMFAFSLGQMWPNLSHYCIAIHLWSYEGMEIVFVCYHHHSVLFDLFCLSLNCSTHEQCLAAMTKPQQCILYKSFKYTFYLLALKLCF